MTEPKKPEVGDRVRVVKDLITGSGRVYLREGETGIVEAIDPTPVKGDPPVEVHFQEREDWVEFDEIEVVTPAAQVDQEYRRFQITGTIKVEVEVTVEGRDYQDASDYFRDNALDMLAHNDTLTLRKAKVTDIHMEDQH